MTNYILLHGRGSGPDMWFPWLNTELLKTCLDVWMPILPDGENPDLQIQLPFLLQSGKINSDSIIICHSASCPLILSFLEKIDFAVKQVVFVAGWFPLPNAPQEKIWQDKYDLPKIKPHSREFTFVVSDNDPWGCTEQLSKPYFDVLGGTLTIVKGAGHFGSNHFKAPLYEFPLLLKLIAD